MTHPAATADALYLQLHSSVASALSTIALYVALTPYSSRRHYSLLSCFPPPRSLLLLACSRPPLVCAAGQCSHHPGDMSKVRRARVARIDRDLISVFLPFVCTKLVAFPAARGRILLWNPRNDSFCFSLLGSAFALCSSLLPCWTLDDAENRGEAAPAGQQGQAEGHEGCLGAHRYHGSFFLMLFACFSSCSASRKAATPNNRVLLIVLDLQASTRYPWTWRRTR